MPRAGPGEGNCMSGSRRCRAWRQTFPNLAEPASPGTGGPAPGEAGSGNVQGLAEGAQAEQVDLLVAQLAERLALGLPAHFGLCDQA